MEELLDSRRNWYQMELLHQGCTLEIKENIERRHLWSCGEELLDNRKAEQEA